MRRRSSYSLDANLNLTNLIDIVFAVLIVFMITAPLMSQGVKVDLPKSKASSLDEKKAIHITLTKDREILINENASNLRSFEKDFRLAFDGDPETAVIVNADRSIPYGFVIELIASIQKQGAKRIGFLTDPTQPTERVRP